MAHLIVINDPICMDTGHFLKTAKRSFTGQRECCSAGVKWLREIFLKFEQSNYKKKLDGGTVSALLTTVMCVTSPASDSANVWFLVPTSPAAQHHQRCSLVSLHGNGHRPPARDAEQGQHTMNENKRESLSSHENEYSKPIHPQNGCSFFSCNRKSTFSTRLQWWKVTKYIYLCTVLRYKF